jgi:Spy/CpxP family protein refolding chaperone
MKIVRTLLLLIVVWMNSDAQVSIPPDKEQLLQGESTGETLVAEMNGFSSPRKILALKDQLGLTKNQTKNIEEMLKNLPVSTTVKGQEIIEAEEDLGKSFESGTINEKTMRTKLEHIGKLRAELRFAYLQIYLKTKKILSANQWERLKELKASEGR